MVLDLIATLGGLIVPPAFDFIKKKFLKPEQETPEATLSSLATTKPEVMPDYLNAIVGYINAKVSFFNRDVVPGAIPRQWVVDLRAAIRPIVTVAAVLALAIDGMDWLELTNGARACFETIASSWFGSRLSVG